MKKSEKKELLNNWPSFSVEERESKLEELRETLSERKYKKLLAAIEKIEISLNEENNYEDYNQNFEEDSQAINEEVSNDEEMTSQEEEYKFNTEDSNEEVEDVSNDEEMTSQEEEYQFNIDDSNEEVEEVSNDEEMTSQEEEYQFNTEDSNDEVEDISFDQDLESKNYENENWVIEDNEIELNQDEETESHLDAFNESFEENIKAFESEVPYDSNPSTSYSELKEQIGSDERAWNKNNNIIYSQEELIYRLTNSQNISDEEYKILLISAQKKIEFIQLLIEKSRMKNAAYSYDFLNSMCWRVDKALKTFLAANKR